MRVKVSFLLMAGLSITFAFRLEKRVGEIQSAIDSGVLYDNNHAKQLEARQIKARDDIGSDFSSEQPSVSEPNEPHTINLISSIVIEDEDENMQINNNIAKVYSNLPITGAAGDSNFVPTQDTLTELEAFEDDAVLESGFIDSAATTVTETVTVAANSGKAANTVTVTETYVVTPAPELATLYATVTDVRVQTYTSLIPITVNADMGVKADDTEKDDTPCILKGPPNYVSIILGIMLALALGILYAAVYYIMLMRGRMRKLESFSPSHFRSRESRMMPIRASDRNSIYSEAPPDYASNAG